MIQRPVQYTGQLLTTKNIPTPNVRRAEAENPWCRFTVKIKLTGMHSFLFALSTDGLDNAQWVPCSFLDYRHFVVVISLGGGSYLCFPIVKLSPYLIHAISKNFHFASCDFTCLLNLVMKFSYVSSPGVMELNAFHFISQTQSSAKMWCVSMSQ